MSEEYNNAGTVRRRPRASHHRTDSTFEQNGNGKSHSTRERNGQGHAGFREEAYREETYYDRASKNERRQRPRRREEEEQDEKPKQKRDLPWREIDAEGPLFRCPFDPWRLYGALKRNLYWILGGAMLLAIIGFFFGAFTIQYKMSLPLIRKTSNAVRTEGSIPNQFTPREYSDGTLYAFMKSGDVIHNVIAKSATNALLAPLHLNPMQLAESIAVVPIPNPDFVVLQLKTFGNMRSMAELLNLYAREAVDYTREVQKFESKAINVYLREQLAEADKRISEITVEMRKLSDSGYVSYDRETDEALTDLRVLREKLATRRLEFQMIDPQIKVLTEALPNTRLQAAQQELDELLLSFTTNHPAVIRKQAEIDTLRKQQSGPGPKAAGTGLSSNPLFMRSTDLAISKPALEREIQDLEAKINAISTNLVGRTGKDMSYALKQAEMDSQKKARDEISKAERESRVYADASLGYFGIHETATPKSIDRRGRWLKVGLFSMFSGLLGFLVLAGMALTAEALDTTLRTPEDIMRITQLPVLATLGDLRKVSAKQQVDWAFRTLTLLKGKLSRNSDQALVCGIISANHGEGRSTWVNLLVSAASQRGLRVLTVDTRPTAAAPASTTPKPSPEPASTEKDETRRAPTTSPQEVSSTHPVTLPDQPARPMSTDPLTSPEQVVEQLENPQTQALVHIPLPGWVWSLERRKQWQKALDSWKHVDNLVIFVELPPACESESMLLAENIPQLIWLVGSGMAESAETKEHLETLRHARANLVGAVLNHAPPPVLNAKIARWITRTTAIAVAFGCLGFTSVFAQNKSPEQQVQLTAAKPAANESMALSGNARRKRAQWQERLTFGPGDVLDIHLYGNSALSRTNVFIGPDGRINYLQATGVTATGLTVEELRQKLDQELARYYTAPRTIVLPVSYSSKKYFMLGKISAKGAFVLDRPITLIEAVARAHGLETGLYHRTTTEIADLGHSFIVRNGEKLQVNFEKLFLEGDLTQNVSIEPNDYVYFASNNAQDIYILGEVMIPGPLGFVSNPTVLNAITDRGGFTEKAFKRRVLVVRGSLNEPETFIIDTGGSLDAYSRDFKLQPKDIVYVSRRPWAKVEELLDEAAQAFIEGAVTTWAGINVGPIIRGRLFPTLP